MELDEILIFLKGKSTIWDSRSPKHIELPFDIKPNEYLRFAEIDFDNKEIHGLVNALSNAKRSLDCQIESLLIALGLYNSAKKHNWNIPKKIEIIKNVGIIAPRVLNKINKVRNIMEHEFIRPDEEQVSDFIDIVTLFNACTDKYLFDFPCGSEIINEENDDFWLDVEFKYPQNYVELEIRQKAVDNEKIKLDMNDAKYIEFLSQYLRVAYDY